MTQESAYQFCVTATEMKSEILDVDGRDSLYVFVWYAMCKPLSHYP